MIAALAPLLLAAALAQATPPPWVAPAPAAPAAPAAGPAPQPVAPAASPADAAGFEPSPAAAPTLPAPPLAPAPVAASGAAASGAVAAPAAAPVAAPPVPRAPPVRSGAGGEALFADANAAFLGGDLARAVALYEALLAEGVASPELETNLGAALQREARHGSAALHFERALFLAPADDDARADLAEARKGNVDRLEGDADDGGSEALTRLLAPLPGGAAAAALIALWTLAWIALGLRLLAPSLAERLPLGPAAAVLFAAAGVAGLLCAGASMGHRLALHRAVVVARSVPAREGPDAHSASPFEVHEGTPVRIEDRENGFARVKLANGLTGWVPQGAVEQVVPAQWGGLPGS